MGNEFTKQGHEECQKPSGVLESDRFKSHHRRKSSASSIPLVDACTTTTQSFQHMLVREQKADFSKFYDVIGEIGQGGLCKVYKIQKKEGKVGGSSRKENVKRTRTKKIISNISAAGPGRLVAKSFGNQTRAKIEDTVAVPRLHSSSIPTNSPLRKRITSDHPKETSSDLLSNDFDEPKNVTDVTHGISTDSNHQTSTLSKPSMTFALKEVNLAMVQKEKIDELRNEVEILKALDHKNIVRAFETFRNKETKKLMIVMELCTGGDLVRTVSCT